MHFSNFYGHDTSSDDDLGASGPFANTSLGSIDTIGNHSRFNGGGAVSNPRNASIHANPLTCSDDHT